MLSIIIDNKQAVLKEGMSIEYVAENRLFTGSDAYSLSITLPLRGCPENIAIFGHIHHADITARKVMFDCEIRSGDFVRFGSATVTQITQSEVTIQFLEGRSESNYHSTFDDIYINELDLGQPFVVNAAQMPPAGAWNPPSLGYSMVALPWVNNASGNLQNAAVYDAATKTYKWHDDTKYLSWQPYLLEIVKRICLAVGYKFDLSRWSNDPKLRYLLICNTLPSAWDIPQFARALPHWTVTEFFEKLELFLGGEFAIDHREKFIRFDITSELLAKTLAVTLEDVTEDFSMDITVEDEKCEYIGGKNLVYKECDNEMWKYYSCDWYIKAYAKDAMVFSNMESLLSYTSNFRKWDGGSYRNDMRQCLFYVANIDTYFIMRSISRVLKEERKNRANLYEYDCKLQAVNLFGGRIVNDSEDADQVEIEFVPAWIDETEDAYGNCLFLDFAGYDDSEGVNGKRKASDPEEKKQLADDHFAEMLQTAILEAGEKEKKAEYYSTIYVGYWDGGIQNQGKLPYPYVEEIYITSDWYYFNSRYSLRLNDKAATAIRGYTPIEVKKKATFKFLCESVPDPRAVFYIRGKRWLCEKLTCNITTNGLSQLVKGVFYPIAD